MDTSDRLNSALSASLDVVELPEDDAEIAAMLDTYGPRIRGLAVRKRQIRAELLDRLPALEIVASYSAGLENIDTDHCRESGITVTNTSHILAEEVANLTVMHCLAVTRQLVRAHEFVRSEAWTRGQFPLTHSLSGMEVGIIGLGHIGQAIARRLEVMGARVSYYGPRKKPVELPYFDSPEALAEVVESAMDCGLQVNTHAIGDRGNRVVLDAYERAMEVTWLTNYYSEYSGQDPDSSAWNARSYACVILEPGKEPELHADGSAYRDDQVSTSNFHTHMDVVAGVGDALITRGVNGPVAFVGSDCLPVKYADQLRSRTPDISFHFDDDLVRACRRIKSARELDCYREGGRIVSDAITRLCRSIIVNGKPVSKNKVFQYRDAIFEAILHRFENDPTLVAYGEECPW